MTGLSLATSLVVLLSFYKKISAIPWTLHICLVSQYKFPSFFKVGTHKGTSRRDLFQGLVRCRVYTMGQVAGSSPCGDLLHIKITKFRALSLKFWEV